MLVIPPAMVKGVKVTTGVGALLSKRVHMIRHGEAPMASAACTKSRRRKLRNSARWYWARFIQPNTEERAIKSQRVGENTAINAKIRKNTGMDPHTSLSRCPAKSTQPPKNP